MIATALGFLFGHWDLLAGAAGLASGGLAFLLPNWRTWLIGGAAALIGIALVWLKLSNANLRADLAAEQTERIIATAERDQEKATAQKNLAAFEAERLAREQDVARRIVAEHREALSRKRVAEITREIERVPTARNQLGPALRPLLRRVQPSP